MISGLTRGLLAVGLCVGLALATSAPARAGGSGLDEPDEAETGTPFFGFIKNLTLGGTIPDAKVVASLKGGNTSFVIRGDKSGHFRFTGFAKDVDPDKVEIVCSVDGYKLARTVRRKLSSDPGAPIEVDCLMSKAAP
jgi:hypothetical protein